MRTLLVFALAGALVAGCSSSNNTSSSSSGSSGTSGTSGSTGDAGDQSPTIAVSGTVVVHPVVGALQDAGLLDPNTPAFANQTLYIDEPLLAILQGVDVGRLASTTLDASGNFTAPSVPTDSIEIGLVGTMASDSPDGGFQSCEVSSGAPSFCSGWARGVSLVWEDWQNTRPSGDISGVTLYGVPVSLAEVLSAKMGLAAGQHLLDKGFVLGYVLDASGHPASGQTFSTTNNSYQVVYLDDQLNPGATSTNSYGMFLIVAPGQPDATHNFGINECPTCKCHSVGSNPGTVLSLIWDPNHPGVTCK